MAGKGIRHIVWDWNGTLFDDQPLVTRATNASLLAVGCAGLDAGRYQDLYRRPLQDFYFALADREFTEAEWKLVEDAFSATYAAGMHACVLAADALTAMDGWAPGSQSLLSMYDHDKLVPLVDSFGLSTSVPLYGSGSQASWAPPQTRIPPAAACPASLLIGLSPHRSSTIPTRTITPPASSRLAAVRLPCSTEPSGVSWAATTSPAASPPNMAMPPSRGIGTTCTSRSLASCIAPPAMATRRTSGVSR